MIYTIDFDYNDFFDAPKLRIGIDDCVYYDSSVLEQIEFEADLVPGPHTLWIEHHGKQINWTTEAHDHHMIIKRILFDGVDLDQLDYCPITHRGRFYPVYEPSYVDSCITCGIELPEFLQPNHYLGHNGVWKLEFVTPELLWIIKEQNPSGIHLEDTIFSTSDTTLNQIKDYFKL
jgi:hypothetical protein